MRITLHIWRQPGAGAAGRMVKYEVANVNQEMSFLEMLDVLNEDLIAKGEDPVAFDRDGRGGLHRVRRMRRDVPERERGAVHGRQDRASRAVAAGSAGARYAGDRDGGAGGGRRVWKLHQYRGVRGGVSQGDQAGRDRAD